MVLSFLLIIINLANVLADTIQVQERFELDLNWDEKLETLQLVKKNGLDYWQILDDKKNLIFEQALITKGHSSKVQKITQVKFHKSQQCLLLHYFDGMTGINGLKSSTRLLSFCYATSDLLHLNPQDLGYVFWDYKAVASYQQLEQGMTIIDGTIMNGKLSALLLLKDGAKTRSWNFDANTLTWRSFPERMLAQYGLKMTR